MSGIASSWVSSPTAPSSLDIPSPYGSLPQPLGCSVMSARAEHALPSRSHQDIEDTLINYIHMYSSTNWTNLYNHRRTMNSALRAVALFVALLFLGTVAYRIYEIVTRT